MDNLQQKLDHLKWLKSVGIEYYCSEQKDSKNSLIKQLKIQKNQNQVIESEILTMPKIKKTPTQAIPAKAKTTHEDSNATAAARKLADNAATLEELRFAVENFQGCDLKKFANKTVFSDGIADSKIMLIGEAPGATEDEEGLPFCGESGLLLDKMLEVIGISRTKNAYITNAIFWRPPANRRPTREEIEICAPFLEKHIALINPKLIILIGGTATTALLGKKITIADVRSNNYEYSNQYLTKPINTTALFHPAYLMRQPTQKKPTWYDLLKIKEMIMSTKVPT